MAKKNFSGGLDSLLGGAPLSKNTETPKEETVKKVEKTVPPTPQKTFFGLTDEQQNKIAMLAKKEGRSEEEIIREAISFYLDFQVDL